MEGEREGGFDGDWGVVVGMVRYALGWTFGSGLASSSGESLIVSVGVKAKGWYACRRTG